MLPTLPVSLEAVEAISWAFGAIAILFTAGRYYLRWRTGGFKPDDISHAFAVLFMICTFAIYSGVIPPLKAVMSYSMEQPPQGPPPMDAAVQELQMASSHGWMCFSGLWAVKLTFMLLYRIIFSAGKGFNVAWWSVMGFNIATYIIAMIGSTLTCGAPKDLFNPLVCTTHAADALTRVNAITAVTNVSSDLATMILPLVMLRTLQMRTSHKASVAFMLCLSFVPIVFEIVRVASSLQGMNVLWCNLELSMAVIVSAMPVYYSLVARRRERRSRKTTYEYQLNSTSRGHTHPSMGQSAGYSMNKSQPRSYADRMDRLSDDELYAGITKTQEIQLHTCTCKLQGRR